VAAILA
jgi:hypothetical protein